MHICVCPSLPQTLVKMETFAPALPRKEVSAAIKPEFIKPIFLHVQELKTMADKDEIDRQKLEDHRTGKRSNPATVYGSASLVQPRYEPIFKPAEAKRNCQPPDSDLSALTPSPAFGSSSDVSMGSDSALSNGGIPKHVNVSLHPFSVDTRSGLYLLYYTLLQGSNYMVPFKFISHKIERSPVTGALNMKRSAQMTPASAVVCRVLVRFLHKQINQDRLSLLGISCKSISHSSISCPALLASAVTGNALTSNHNSYKTSSKEI